MIDINPHFNSIKVQLEPSTPSGSVDTSSFQFHKGTIRTKCRSPSSIISAKFQFHKGTIRTANLPQKRLKLFYFNSIKVQLELRQTGSVEQHHGDFNSIKVQLEPVNP